MNFLKVEENVLQIVDTIHHKNVWCSLDLRVKNGFYICNQYNREFILCHKKYKNNKIEWIETFYEFGLDSGTIEINHKKINLIDCKDKNLNIICDVYLCFDEDEIIGIKINY